VSTYLNSPNPVPSVVYRLEEYRETDFGDRQHPVSIWNNSIFKVLNSMEEILKLLLECQRDKKVLENILPKYETLLHYYASLTNDDAKSIVEAFFQNEKELKEHKKLLKLPNLQAHSGKIINAIKHEQRYLIVVNHFIDELIIPGFSVVTNKRHLLSPCMTIHWKDGDMAFSFYYEMRYLIVGIYQLSDILSRIIPTKGVIGEDLSQGLRFKSILEMFIEMPKVYLPNEYKKEIPYISLEEAAYFVGVEPKNSRNTDTVIATKQLSQEISYTADGLTNSFALIDVF
jgi:hypothetical protein